MTRGGEPWGHSITELAETLPADVAAPPDLIEAANRLDKHSIPARYPNGFASGYPGKLYTRGEAEGAIADARTILEFCRAVYLDRARRLEEIREAAGRAAARLPALRRVILFGSLVSGIPTPRSDADLLVVLSDSAHPDPRDRVPEVRRALGPLPCPVDLFVLTAAELDRYTREGHPLVREARERGRDLLS